MPGRLCTAAPFPRLLVVSAVTEDLVAAPFVEPTRDQQSSWSALETYHLIL
jgi:hypothetical protein